MIKQDIVNRIADDIHITKTKAEQAVEAALEALRQSMKKGERIELRKFGVFIVKPRKGGVGRNPRSGEVIPIPSGKTVRFKPGKEIRYIKTNT